MEATRDKRFDQNVDFKFVADLFLDIARERSLESLMEKLIRAGVARLDSSLRVEIWLIEEGDICPHCPRRNASTRIVQSQICHYRL